MRRARGSFGRGREAGFSDARDEGKCCFRWYTFGFRQRGSTSVRKVVGLGSRYRCTVGRRNVVGSLRAAAPATSFETSMKSFKQHAKRSLGKDVSRLSLAPLRGLDAMRMYVKRNLSIRSVDARLSVHESADSPLWTCSSRPSQRTPTPRGSGCLFGLLGASKAKGNTPRRTYRHRVWAAGNAHGQYLRLFLSF